MVKVSLPIAGCEFSGNIVGKPEFHVSEYYVYMTQGSKKLIIRCPSCEPLNADFGISVETAAICRFRVSGYNSSITPPNSNQAAQTNTNGTSTAVASTNAINGHEYVDLGLPSGIKWATCNIGTSSSDYGDASGK